MHKKRLSIEVTTTCNFKCLHCFNRPSSGRAHASLEFEPICRILNEAHDLGCRDVLLTGGEPLMWRHFVRFYEHMAVHGGFSVKLNTNASLVDEHVASMLAGWPPANIHVSIYGWDQASYAAITGNPMGYAAARKGISLLAEKGLRFYLLIPGIRLLAENHAKMDAFARNLGSEMVVRDWILGDHVYRDEVKNEQITRLRLSPQEAAKGLVRETGGVGRIMDELLSPTPRDYSCLLSCLRHYKQVIVDSRLNLLPCLILRHPEYVFDLQRSTLREGLLFVQRLSRIPHKRTDEKDRCGMCQIRGLCRNCPPNALLEHGDLEGIGEYYCQVSQEIAKILGLPK
jgi:radical SAM protein with 4Fe4S-binding SPASM domain